MESDEKTFPQAEQSETCVPEQAIGKGQPAEVNCHEEFQHSPNPRKDKNHFHATRHGVLSRYPLEALASLGENTRNLRRIERKFREELKPSGILATTLFDRFFSSYLRCLLAARAEAATFAQTDQPAGEPPHFVSLKERDVPTLVLQDSSGASTAHLPADLLRQLALAARYDAHFSKEMYRALALLLVLRNGGEAALDRCIGKILGVSRES
jgi:hypothetical protein